MKPDSSGAAPRSSSTPTNSGGLIPQIGPVLLVIALAVVAMLGIWTDRLRPLPDALQPVTGLRWWFTPMERNAFMRLPAVQGALSGVHALDSRAVWAVGDDGLIIGTSDGGRNWKRGLIVPGDAPTPPKAAAKAAAASRNREFPWGLIQSAQAEIQAAPVRDPSAQNDPKQQAAADAQSKEIAANAAIKARLSAKAPRPVPEVGKKPDVSASLPKPPVTPPPATAEGTAAAHNDLLAVRFLTPAVGVVAGWGGIFRTVDGGSTWHSVRAGGDKLHALATTPQGRLVALGAEGILLTSDDQGARWIERLRGRESLAAITFTDARTGLVLGRSGALWSTSDGGDNWTQISQSINASQTSSANRTYQDITSLPSGELFLVGGGEVAQSKNGGRQWSFTRLPGAGADTAQLKAVRFLDAKHGLVLGGNRNWVTDDGGASWTESSSPCVTLATCTAISIDPGGVPYVVGSDAVIARGIAFGTRWSVLTANGSSTFRAFGFGDSRTAIIVGNRGTALGTRDGGETWVMRDTGVAKTLRAVAFADPEHAVAVGEEGTVLLTRDHGRTWLARPSAQLNYQAVHFDNERNGIALASNGTGVGMITTDGGATWQAASDAVATARELVLAGSIAVRAGDVPVLVTYGKRRAMVVISQSGDISQKAGDATILPDGTVDPTLPWSLITRIDFGDEKNGIAIGRSGTAMRTEDGGRKWQSTSAGTALDLLDLHFTSPTNAVALASGRVFLTRDAGKTWVPTEYRRYPSRWLWLASFALLLCSSLLIRQRINRPQVAEQAHSVADDVVSDSPIGWKDPDAVGLRAIALAMSRFLRNRRTQPPITIAVTGEWGTGKSSLMNLLREDLKRYGFRPVWFNAWHHQSGENLLASLLANIHAQGVPPLLTLGGIDFRLSLLLVRIRRFWFRLAVTLLMLTVVFFSYRLLGENAAALWDAFTAGNKSGTGDGGGLKQLGAASKLVGLVVAALAPVLGAIRAVTAFGLQPGKLIASVATSRDEEVSKLQPGARYRFAKEFGDFANALDPRTLVIFIDDLDRCRKENVVEVLEAVNFLVSSGRCVVVLGMARRWVEACVGRAFQDLAEATANRPAPAQKAGSKAADRATNEPPPVVSAVSTATSAADSKATQADDQRQFAIDYLEKLINIEIPIPPLTSEASRLILRTSVAEPETQSWRQRFADGFRRTVPVALVVFALAGIIGFGFFLAEELKSLDVHLAAKTSEVTAQAEARDTGSAAGSGGASVTDVDLNRDESGRRRVAFESSPPVMSVIGYLGTGVPAILSLGALVGLLMFARREVRTDDSEEFHKAIEILQPLIVLGGNSPRSLKRFLNRLRYVAMRVTPASEIPTWWESSRHRIADWFYGSKPRSSPAGSAQMRREPLEENVLVALAAIERISPDWLKALAAPAGASIKDLVLADFEARIPDLTEREQVADRLQKSIDAFNEEFPEEALFVDAARDAAYRSAFYRVISREAGFVREVDAPPEPRREARAS